MLRRRRENVAQASGKSCAGGWEKLRRRMGKAAQASEARHGKRDARDTGNRQPPLSPLPVIA